MDKIKLICFDLDETLISHSSWKRLGLALGISVEEDKELYREYKNGVTTYQEWNNKILARYQEHEEANREGITKILSKYTYREGSREIVGYLKEKGYILVLISGSIDILVDMVARDLGIPFAKANNTLVFDENDRLKNFASETDDVFAKANHLKDFCKKLNIEMKECACVADGDNDIEMFRQTGHGITFKGSIIENESWKVIDSFSDLKDIFK
jgi:phosphoserine phosphatase